MHLVGFCYTNTRNWSLSPSMTENLLFSLSTAAADSIQLALCYRELLKLLRLEELVELLGHILRFC